MIPYETAISGRSLNTVSLGKVHYALYIFLQKVNNQESLPQGLSEKSREITCLDSFSAGNTIPDYKWPYSSRTF